MFERNSIKILEDWAKQADHKPLVLRGARQVGKTCLIRDFGVHYFENVVEINFDHPDNFALASIFEKTPPKKIITLLETHFKTKIIPKKTLLFLDEIQTAPKVLAVLRYFYEDFPDLHILAAGSLLDFVLADHDFSMPVGRIEYMYLSQCSFQEFLNALGEKPLLNFLKNYTLKEDIPEVFHLKLMELTRLYFILGGMPEVIQEYNQTKDLNTCFRAQRNILATYENDFHKYKKRVNHNRIKKVFQKIPHLVGQKIKYVNIDAQEQSKTLAQTLDLLVMAHVCHRVYHSSCQGIPLHASINEHIFKLLFLDVGLLSQSRGLSILDIEREADLTLIHQGAVTEQFIGQHLLYSRAFYEEPKLHYWQREKKNSSAEVDYVISQGSEIIPIEVKSGKTGTLKSLKVFIDEHKSRRAIRFNSDKPSIYKADYELISLPFYLVEEAPRLLEK